MKKAIYLGAKDENGEEDLHYLPPYKKGDILTVYFRNKPYTSFPWADKPHEPPSRCIFRDNELEFLPEKELDLNDYL